MCWLFVPKLRADGWLRIEGQEQRIDGELAYHDHNWGRFWWGDDFGWTWGTMLSQAPENPWSLVFLQMTDRRRLRCLSKALYVWHHDEPAAIFRHAALRTRPTVYSVASRTARCRLLCDSCSTVRCQMYLNESRSTRRVQATQCTPSFARIRTPAWLSRSEVSLNRSTVLCETSGTATGERLDQRRDFDFDGTGVFEFLHG